MLRPRRIESCLGLGLLPTCPVNLAYATYADVPEEEADFTHRSSYFTFVIIPSNEELNWTFFINRPHHATTGALRG